MRNQIHSEQKIYQHRLHGQTKDKKHNIDCNLNTQWTSHIYVGATKLAIKARIKAKTK